MLTPKKPKFSKQHRGRMCGQSKSKDLAFGEFGIQALEPIWLKSQQIEATRRSILRLSKKMGKL
jgi:large subunit ribosomal protein L16